MSDCSSTSITLNSWLADVETAWWPARGETVQVLATETLWGSDVATVVVPSCGRVERVAATELRTMDSRKWEPSEVAWRAAAGLARRALADGEPLAIARGGVDPLPHQLLVLERALATEPMRLLLADEVGLGKTIEAGLIITELKARGLIRRVLVVAPKGVQLQWVAEMADRFHEEFVLVGAGGVPIDAGINPWRAFDQIICSLDAVKPLRARAGWSAVQVAEHNELRAQAVVDAGWDLVVIDEAHHVAGSSEEVARYLLGRHLAETTPRLLLLSATPHSGKSEAFGRLLGLLDEAFLHGRPLLRENVAPFVIRTDKHQATDAAGNALFRPRQTTLATVPYGSRHVERSLYDAVTDYVRHGYRRAQIERRPAIGFLVLLMQRLVSSSTAAILASLERRVVAVTIEGQQLRLFSDRLMEWDELSGEEQQAALTEAQGSAWTDERAEVEILVDLARKAATGGIDAKARYLLDLLGQLAAGEGDPGVKAVIFTEFVPTQDMLLEVLGSSGINAVAINGSMSIVERRHAQEAFRDVARVLVSTDAGGEGVNLQFAHVVINYDLPWSPTRIEQRIGRVDRIGQTHDVAAFNLVLESSIDARVLAVLEEKLQVILAELGTDKASDVLASIDTRVGRLYAAALLNPGEVGSAAELLDRDTRQDLAVSEPFRDALGPNLLPSRVERSTELRRWLDVSDAALIRLGRAPGPQTFPVVLPSEPVPTIGGTTAGWWTMWEVGVGIEQTCVALFQTEAGALRPDLADRLWVQFADRPELSGSIELDSAVYAGLYQFAADHTYRSTNGTVPTLALKLAVRVEA